MTPSRSLAVFLVVVVLASGVAVADVPPVRLTVSGAVVAPATPVVGEQVTVTVTVSNSVGSDSPVSLDDVRLEDGDRRLSRARNVGSLSPGDDVTVPLAATFDRSGPRVLTLVVSGTDESGDDVRIERPVPVVVEAAPPLVEFDAPGAAVDDRTRVAVTLSNPTTAPMRNLVVTFNESAGRPEEGRRTLPTLAAGETATLNLTTVPDAPGERALSVDVAYAAASGTAQRTTFERTVVVAPFVDDVGLAVAPVREEEAAADQPGGLGGLLGGLGGVGGGVTTAAESETDRSRPVRYEVTVTNFGTVSVDGVVVAAAAPNASVPRVGVDGPLAPGESATATLDLSSVPAPETVAVTATYRAGVRDGTVTRAVPFAPAVADVRLTDLDATRDGDRLRLVGNVANLGDAELTGVAVAVDPTADVTPTFPQRDYFVGTLDGSDFAPFELTAAVNESATDVPVRVFYRVDGHPTESVVVVSLGDAPEESAGSALSLAPAGVATAVVGPLAVVALLVGLGIFRRRRIRRTDEPPIPDRDDE
jgi:hypothetical protein